MTHDPSFEVRDLSFDLGPHIPRYWFGGRRSISLYLNGLSIFFPHGERFFVTSVKAFRDRVKDEQLKEEVRLFCGQEGVHSREHVHYNRMLEAQGYPAATMEQRVQSLLAWVTRFLPARKRLAVTACLEHFTAILARTALMIPSQFDVAHPTMASLWRWHAAEESEHKAVAFDVYRAAGGYYLERVLVMLATTVIFLAKVTEHQCRLMRVDGILFSIREWAALLRFVYGSPWSGQMIRGYLAWYRPGFHPHQVDDRTLLEAWRATLSSETHYKRRGETPPAPRLPRLDQLPAGS
jgi:predicted metal-dependent hydrolase